MKRRDFLKIACCSLAAFSVWSAPWLPGPSTGRRGRATSCSPVDERAVNVVAVGDIMAHLPVINSGLMSDGSYDFRPHFKYVRPIFQNADLVMGNLETPLAGGKYSGYPAFNGPDELADALKWAGVKALTLANNHSLDKGWSGLERTAQVLKKLGLIYTGAFLSAEDRASPRIFKANGVSVGLLSYTYGVNFGAVKYPKGETWRLNLASEELIRDDLKKLEEARPDFKIVNIHFGEEYQRVPNKKQKAQVKDIFQAGADLVIGHHPHVVQPAVVHYGAGGWQAAVFSLGNFISNQQDRYTDQGLMLSVKLGLDHFGRKTMAALTLRQTRCIRRNVDGKSTYRVLPVLEAINSPSAYGLTGAEAAFLAKDQIAMSRHLVDFPLQK